MNKDEVRKKIDSVTLNSRYVRVNSEHPLELYLGKNQEGEPTLRYNGFFLPMKVIGNNVLEVKHVRTDDYNSILFSYSKKEDISLFYHFCADLISRTEFYTGKDGYREIVNRYNQWRKMFNSRSKLLSENEVLGLIGELLFLKEYSFKIYGVTNGLAGWSGPEPTHKDFSYGHEWFEIKAINDFKQYVLISSVEQLDSTYDGELIVYIFEKMSPSFDGIKINKLVAEVMNEIKYDSDNDLFIEKLKQVGYTYNEAYDNYVYHFIKKDEYAVSRDFPKIKAENLPQGIKNVQYELILSSIEKFKKKDL